MKNKLDFLVIGGQKCGTTSLFQYMREHPDIYIPKGKEAPFFSNNDLFNKGTNHYFDSYFGNASPKRLWGTVTPHYLSDPKTPRRIRDFFPDVKLIAVLRDPIDRAYSHYIFNRKREWEERTFDDAIKELSVDAELMDSRRMEFCIENENRGYIAWGEYGRQLERYFRLFPASQIMVAYSNDLLSNPLSVLQKIFCFLEIDSRFVPSTISKKYNIGSTKKKINISLERLNRIIPFLSVLRRLGKYQTIENIQFWYTIWNSKSSYRQTINFETSAALKRIYLKDLRILKARGFTVPWESRLVT